jgi:hypothetical protein
MEEIEEKPSRALPIGVAAGLAVAVFGVLFAIRGTGKAADTPPSSTDTPVATTTGDKPATDTPADKPADPPPASDKPADPPVATTTPTTTTPPTTTTTPAPAATPDAGKPAAPAATPDAAPAAKPADSGSTLATLTFVVTPKEAASKADITVDKKPVLGDRFQVQKGDTPVKVVVRSTGYVTYEKEIVPTGDQSVPIELKKVETAATTPTTTPSKTTTPTVTKTPTTTPSKTTTTPKKPKKPKVEL